MQFMHEIAVLFPVFPRKKTVPKVLLGTNLVNGDNGLRGFFEFVPSVPKKKGQYPKEGARCDAIDWCRAMPFGNGS
ncbi:hypothetical protein [Comamonas antarctica]|uniref:Uncharacterized protein n=1 Tax=Comamonas antarctica TaxID=2743470 RepID=A0A6N1X2S3_9BURK|nr:hypothetical protein [Comamonas antarctica]QKV52030.1 hypothetical protein HUK68_03430 [Comamonas antarctica]